MARACELEGGWVGGWVEKEKNIKEASKSSKVPIKAKGGRGGEGYASKEQSTKPKAQN